jgi:hypothetical protein
MVLFAVIKVRSLHGMSSVCVSWFPNISLFKQCVCFQWVYYCAVTVRMFTRTHDANYLIATCMSLQNMVRMNMHPWMCITTPLMKQSHGFRKYNMHCKENSKYDSVHKKASNDFSKYKTKPSWWFRALSVTILLISHRYHFSDLKWSLTVRLPCMHLKVIRNQASLSAR